MGHIESRFVMEINAMNGIECRAWYPVEGLPEQLYCEGLYDDHEHFRVLLKGDGTNARTLRIAFESVIAYRNINESYRARTWSSLTAPLPPLTIVENSRWIAWLREESGGVLDDVPVTHYAIFTPEDCIDIASAFPPEVEWLNDR